MLPTPPWKPTIIFTLPRLWITSKKKSVSGYHSDRCRRLPPHQPQPPLRTFQKTSGYYSSGLSDFSQDHQCQGASDDHRYPHCQYRNFLRLSESLCLLPCLQKRNRHDATGIPGKISSCRGSSELLDSITNSLIL